MAKFRLFSLFTLVLHCCAGLTAQYLENFTGQKNKGLVNAILRRRAISCLFQFCAFIFISALPQKGLSQIVIGGWDVSTLPGGVNNFGPSPYAATQTAANVTVGGLTRGSGISTTGTAAARGWGGTSWSTAFNNVDSSVLFNKFFTFTVKANAGYTLSLSSIDPFDYRRSSTGPQLGAIQYQINGGAYTTIATVSFPSTSSSGASVGSTDLSGISALQNLPSSSTVTFRIVPYRSSSSTGTFYIFDTGNSTANDFAVNGSVCALPSCNITGPDFVCNNTSGITYTAPAGMSAYNWSISGNGSISGATNGQSVSVTSGNFLNNYTLAVTITNANGCTSTCSKQSDIFLLKPPADITVSPGNTVCLGATLDLSVAAAASSTVAWTGEGVSDPDGAFIPNPFAFYGFDNVTTAIPTTTGPHIYGVTVTTDYGCSNTGSVNVTVNPLPAAPTCPGSSSACLNTPPYSLSGASPGGGTYSGPGVSAGNFNPAAAGAGMHTITYTVTDGNGCSNSCTFTITVNSPPNVTCPSYSNVCSTASPFALSGGSPGGGTYSGPGVSAGTFNPAAAGTGMHTIQYTVTDGNGCTGTCTFTITVETCSSNIDFSGKIIFSNNNALGVNNATVTLAGSANGSDVTDANGDFYINTALSSGSFTLTPAKTTSKLNGVTAADATAIQQHAANSVLITDLYKQVAADVNKSNSINTLDASIITQSLLGNPAALAQFKTSWRFVPTSHMMTNPPWNFPEKRTYTNINSPQSGQDFYGIKTGDVVSAFANPANFGTGQPLVLQDKDRQLQAGETFMVEFSAGQMDGLAAFQCALRFDPEQLQFIEVQPLAGLPLTMDNFGTFNIAEGEIRLVWAQATEVAVAEATPVFRLQFTALQSGSKLSEVLQLDESELPALAYDGALAESKIELVFSELTGTGNPAGAAGVQLLQNRPNPFTGTTAIAFVLPESCEAQLRIFDVSGKMLAEKKAQYPAGRNEEIFHLQGASGVLWYELTTPFGVLTKKMAATQK